MKTMIIYDSGIGNIEKIANATAGLRFNMSKTNTGH
jgi:hypothetical protein